MTRQPFFPPTSPSRVLLTTTIPYVNASPHLGFALEAVQADLLARHHRRRGDQVRLQTGTDDNSLKNVLAAEAAGVGVTEWVDRHAEAIAALREPLALSYDDFIRTSRDKRHAVGVERLWRACAAAGDLYRGRYEGWYCVGCEAYYTADDLDGGRCPEHGTEPAYLAEENWFFRLSRYAGPLREAVTSGRLRIEPASRRNEVLALIEGGLRDFSISRSRQRARGWGIPVPDDPDQVIYVWWDALGNYVTSLDFGEACEPKRHDGGEACEPKGHDDGEACEPKRHDGGTDGGAYRHWWLHADRRIHLLGKGVLRFHAVYWPAMLLSAGEPLPTDLLVHDYLTAGGKKIAKSTGGGADPVALAARYGTDAVRWWLLREVPRAGDVDFTPERLVARANADLAGGFGNLVNRVVTMVHRYRDGRVPASRDVEPIGHRTAVRVDEALAGYDIRRACEAVQDIVDEANGYVERVRPWELARSGDPRALDAALATLVSACRALGAELAPFLPGAAAAITAACTGGPDGRLPAPHPLFPVLRADPAGPVR